VRGVGWIEKKPKDATEMREIDAAPFAKGCKKRWASFIRNVYATEPFTGPKCQAEMRSSAALSSRDQPMSLKKF